MLVVISVNTRGEKHFLAVEDGVRESTQSWREVLLAMKQRGFTRLEPRMSCVEVGLRQVAVRHAGYAGRALGRGKSAEAAADHRDVGPGGARHPSGYSSMRISASQRFV